MLAVGAVGYSLHAASHVLDCAPSTLMREPVRRMSPPPYQVESGMLEFELCHEANRCITRAFRSVATFAQYLAEPTT